MTHKTSWYYAVYPTMSKDYKNNTEVLIYNTLMEKGQYFKFKNLTCISEFAFSSPVYLLETRFEIDVDLPSWIIPVDVDKEMEDIKKKVFLTFKELGN